jgi:hypothetical protein
LIAPSEIFEHARAKIERAASSKFDRTTPGDYEALIVTFADLDLDADEGQP